MPNTFVGLLLFVVGLAPGATFLAIHHRGPYASRSSSALHELTTVVLASLVFDTASLVFVRLVGPLAGPISLDIDELVASPGSYLRNSFDIAAVWFAVLILVAVGLAAVGAGVLNRPKVHKHIQKSAMAKWMFPNSPRIVSGWTTVIRDIEPDQYKLVTCQFDDGSRLVGWLHSFHLGADDTADRDIVLSAPLSYCSKDGRVEGWDYGAVAISARSLRFLYVDNRNMGPDSQSEGAGADRNNLQLWALAGVAAFTVLRSKGIRSRMRG